MDLKLSGRTAVVTGASRGIGLATVQALQHEGVRVVGVARTITPELAAAADGTVAADLATAEGAEELIAGATTDLGGIDLLVNNAGGGDPAFGGFAALEDASWQRTLDVNLLSAVRVTRAALPSLIERRGAVVNVSSIGAWEPAGGPSVAYDVAKAALRALGRSLANELGPQGVRVATVSPGPTRTAIWEAPDGVGARLAAATGVSHEEFVRQLPTAMGVATGRLIEPQEVAALIVFLLSAPAASITGSDHRIDGGAVRSP